MPTDVVTRRVVALFDRVRDEFGRVDVLFNNAGVFGPPAPFDEVAFEDWQASSTTNLTGASCARRRPSG